MGAVHGYDVAECSQRFACRAVESLAVKAPGTEALDEFHVRILPAAMSSGENRSPIEMPPSSKEDPMSQPATAIGITGISTVAVPVTDQERALAFYVDTLGFEKTRDAAFGPDSRWVEVAPPGASTTIALPPLGEVSPGVDTGIRLTTPNAEAEHAALRARGVNVDSDVLRFGPGVPPMFTLRDPDGNKLYVVESA
jgi:catechol 2,3-dioxygenase-like lactoylglutathione lyase family enzyme